MITLIPVSNWYLSYQPRKEERQSQLQQNLKVKMNEKLLSIFTGVLMILSAHHLLRKQLLILALIESKVW